MYISHHAPGGIFAAFAHTDSLNFFWRTPALAMHAQLQSSWALDDVVLSILSAPLHMQMIVGMKFRGLGMICVTTTPGL
jgi:hypothetical protein